MIKSMTGYARAEHRSGLGVLNLELRSVNHRYLETHFRLPEPVRGLENDIRRQISARIKRGKLDVRLDLERADSAEETLVINERLAAAVAMAAESIGKKVTSTAPLDPMALLQWPGVVSEPVLDTSWLAEVVQQLVETALDGLVASRSDEGARLDAMLQQRAEGVGRLVGQVRDRLPVVRERLVEKLTGLVQELEISVDDERFSKSLANMAQKVDIAEELDRLDSHVVALEKTLARDEPVGRRLDFLMQEFNREANTLASKSVDTETTQMAVDMKVLIEQMREQVQNVE